MNNESGSVLQKASFALLVIIAAGLGYLIVRERGRSEQRAAEAQSAAAASASNPSLQPAPWNPAEMKSSFKPLRPHSEGNVVRVVTNRVPVVVRANFPVVPATGIESTAPLAVTAFVSAPPVPAAIASGIGGALGGSSVSGHVILRGTPPVEKIIALDALCGRLNPAPLTTRHFVVDSDGGLANTFVYIQAGAPATASTSVRPTLDQIGCEYQPYVMGVQVGQTFNVRNSDPSLHNVHALPRRPGNRERNVGQPVKGMVTPFVFNSPEVFVQFKCDVHPWMFAYVAVVDHPWFAVTDKNGNFALPSGLPPGRYTIAAVHLKAGEVTREIQVTDQDLEPLNFTLDVPKTLAKTNTP